ncbi:hypothetical protein ES703_108535 [subsurface metagenome]
MFQGVGFPFDGDLLLLHSLEESSLGAGGSPVQFINQKHVGEDGSGHEGSAAVGAVEVKAEDVSG